MKAKTKKQKKADKAFIKKVSSLMIGGKAVEQSTMDVEINKCPGCGGKHKFRVCLERQQHDDSAEHTVTA